MQHEILRPFHNIKFVHDGYFSEMFKYFMYVAA